MLIADVILLSACLVVTAHHLLMVGLALRKGRIYPEPYTEPIEIYKEPLDFVVRFTLYVLITCVGSYGIYTFACRLWTKL